MDCSACKKIPADVNIMCCWAYTMLYVVPLWKLLSAVLNNHRQLTERHYSEVCLFWSWTVQGKPRVYCWGLLVKCNFCENVIFGSVVFPYESCVILRQYFHVSSMLYVHPDGSQCSHSMLSGCELAILLWLDTHLLQCGHGYFLQEVLMKINLKEKQSWPVPVDTCSIHYILCLLCVFVIWRCC